MTFVGHIHAIFDIPNFPQSPDIGQKSVEGIYNFWISGQTLINKNCHNFGTSDGIDTKLEPVTTFHKRKKATPKKFDGDVM